MWMHLVYLKLELKRACKRLPHLYAGAIILLAMAGVIALLSSRMLYGDQVVGRVPVGVSVPQKDVLARQAVQMISSLESVESVCDFQYMDRETCLRELDRGNLYAVLDVPEGFVEGIMNGTNIPVKVWLSEDAGAEGKLFQELADAGALTLSASQAGIYAGNELYQTMGLHEAVRQLEADLNKKYMDYSLGRAGYFRHQSVQATGDVSTSEFYMISVYVLFLFLGAIPVSGYLLPAKHVMRRKLKLFGIGKGYQAAVKVLAVGMLLSAATLPVLTAAVWTGLAEGSRFLAAAWLLSCIGAAAVVVLVYELAGSLLGGIMLLFFVITAQHFLAGGFLPLVFLPASVQNMAAWLPSAILMDTIKMAVTMTWEWETVLECGALIGGAWLLAMLAEVIRS